MKTDEEKPEEKPAPKGRAAKAKDEAPLTVPEVLLEAAPALIKLAEQLMQGPGRGAEKRKFVREALKALARAHDFEKIPDIIEHPLEDALIEAVVQFAFMTIPGLWKKPEPAQKAA